ncbi:hypothetical protein M409DRAFT_19229 [Zasmidium cellare ATCC 36951]|uniref:FAD-binding domain-containing protein n=1 Tax=Zasmidium cellare ATCC 36951 TaxID=1080233 RepID=A0A6A6CT27_ZASCE|nr:uncharacterized protein M409DRAFT_19229 [Zasmidium cellare ATCC 36951]KAF2170407.1 hypothetical protein M409DRAFT_19229 [Zasmidium cellare ATCC 36951]
MGSVPEQKKIRIALVGGGIAGLSLAIGLAHASNLEITVYEATKEYREVGQGLAMHSNAIAAMESIDPAVFKAWRDSSSLVGSPEDADTISVTTVSLAWGPDTGAKVAELGQAKARKTVSRADLLSELLKVLQQRGGRIQMGKRLKEIQDLGKTVRLTFEDSSEVTADCLLGAEGAHSKTREYLLGADHPALPVKNPARYVSLRSMIPMEAARTVIDDHWTRNVSIRIGPHGWITTMPVKKGTVLLIGTTFTAPTDEDITTTPLPLQKFGEYSAEFQRLIELSTTVHADRIYFWDHDPAPTYVRGRVCMMGDAAHCITPFAGNGAAQALEDTAVLKALFQQLNTSEQIPALLAAFDQIRRPRSQKVVEISRQFGRINMMLDPPDHNLDEIRCIYGEGAAYCSNVDIEAQNQEAVRALRQVVE